MEVTEIRKERGRCFLLLSDGQRIAVPYSIFNERPFSPGDELDLEEYDQWLMVRQYRFALERAVGYLAMRPCSKKEVSDKLLKTGYRPCTVEMVIYKLEQEGFLNDADFALAWAASRSRRQLGRGRIAQELRQKGIDADGVEEALSRLDPEDELETATALARKGLHRAKAGEDRRKVHARVTALLARHGYSYDIARKAIAAAGKTDPDPE